MVVGRRATSNIFAHGCNTNQQVFRPPCGRMVTAPTEPSKPSFIGDCPDVEVEVNGGGSHSRTATCLTKLLRCWSAIFAAHDENFGRTRAVRHQIPTGIAPRVENCSVLPSLYSELRNLLQDMLNYGVAIGSSSVISNAMPEGN
ncbi:hypothetical protein AAFF_G00357250 [Aldrovandia affinis]|uniref:Uncharacterized protein n=1 Tax=Aldrovandia affinis TaxID=143900 RepID=A0AAD7T9I5_9TELE|nr:hypothetical protein AAFF_G00357250 [Aldrovandia affinis]